LTGSPRYLVVTADDFGRSGGINHGIARAHELGIVTSASLMVRWPAAAEAAEYARAHPALGVGLHLDLGEWVHDGLGWTPIYQVVADESLAAVAAEFERQLDAFRSLMGHAPTHLDSHQHVHLAGTVRRVLVDAGAALGVPVRLCTPGVAHIGGFYGQTGTGEPLPDLISVDALLRLLGSLGPGISELGCHPSAEPELASAYADERPDELRVLCDPRVRAFLEREGIELCNFRHLPAELWAAGHDA
jgi:chitin disaccharide deacetylase